MIVNFRIDKNLVKRLDELSSKFLISRSELIRHAIVLYLSTLENLGFYFKPSLVIPKMDFYEERNSVTFDLGNFITISSFVISYAGIGEKENDSITTSLDKVAEIMANQAKIECLCRFIEPKVALLSTGNDVEYSLRFLKEFKSKFNGKVILASSENIVSTTQSFFSINIIGMRDIKIRNTPKRGDRIFLYGEILNGEEVIDKRGISVKKVEKLRNAVIEGKANSIFPVKSDGLYSVCNYAASIAGGKAVLRVKGDKGCPSTAVIVTADEKPLNGGIEIGEIF